MSVLVVVFMMPALRGRFNRVVRGVVMRVVMGKLCGCKHANTEGVRHLNDHRTGLTIKMKTAPSQMSDVVVVEAFGLLPCEVWVVESSCSQT